MEVRNLDIRLRIDSEKKTKSPSSSNEFLRENKETVVSPRSKK